MTEDITNKVSPVKIVDLTVEVCPMTFVKAKIHLDAIATGETIEFVLKKGEQMRNVPRSIKEEGHRIEKVRQDGDKFYILVRKNQ